MLRHRMGAQGEPEPCPWPHLQALTPPHLPVLCLSSFWTLTQRGLATIHSPLLGPPVLPPLLWLLGPFTKTLVLIHFRAF
jgi:hypothetical protein